MSQKDLGRRTALKVKFNNVDITDDITENIISLTYTDATEGEADDLRIVIHDRDGKWVKDWLRREMEQRDSANADIAKGGGADTSDAGAQTYTVTAKIGLAVRAGRGTGYKQIGAIPYGATIQSAEIVSGWATISYSGQTGYINANYLTPAGASGSVQQAYTVTAKIGLNVRAGRGTGYRKLGALSYGATVTATEIVSGWATISYNGQNGYVCASYLAATTVSSGGGNTAKNQDGSGTAHAKYTKVSAVITAMNADGNGGDKVLDCGKFELDSVRFTTPPNRLEMSATSLSYESNLRKTKKTRGYSGSYLKGIAESIAKSGGYDLMYVSSFNPYYSYILQDDLSDVEFLHQRCEAAGLRLKVTDGIFVIYDCGENDSRDAAITITMGDGSYSKVSLDSTLAMTAYSSCHVSYEADNGTTYEATFTPPTGYSEGEVLEVKEQVSSNAEAMELAIRRLRKANKGEISGKITMPGNPAMVAGINIMLNGFGDFDGKFSVDKATHKIPPYTTEIEISKVVEGY